MYRYSILIHLIFLSGTLLAQVPNNNIEQRIELKLDSFPIHSSTKNASVQWECINKKLTNTCLVYHNDQWFYFTPPQFGRYYLNIINQECRNLKGVQVLVIEGNPCETDTYKLKHCTSFTDQNDTFIMLDSLREGTQYLVNIDGFLGDQCDFNIQFATTPIGFPNNHLSMDTLSLKSIAGAKEVTLRWHASQDQLDELSYFEVSRKKLNDKKAVILGTVPVRSNALGVYSEEYEYMDSLRIEGDFTYRIIGVDKISGERYLLDQSRIQFRFSKLEYEKLKYVAIMPLNFPFKGEVEILIYDDPSGKFLNGKTVTDGRNTTIPIDLTRYINMGYRHFLMRARNLKSRNVITKRFSLNESGEVIQGR